MHDPDKHPARGAHATEHFVKVPLQVTIDQK